MKHFLPILIVFLYSVLGFSQSKRTVLIEEFTQASCPPCEATTPALNAITALNATKLVQVRYQTSWPGVDPMNADNPADVKARVDYYKVTGVPSVFADGTESPSSGALPQTLIDEKYNTTAPILISLTHTLSANLKEATVVVKIKNEGTVAFNLGNDKLRVALIEEAITWPEPPGSTSITVFEAVMKNFFTTPAGADVPEIAPGQTYEVSYKTNLPNVVYDLRKLNVVAWVQDDDDQSILNSATSTPVAITGVPDLAIKNESVVEGGYCEYKFTPIAEVSNVSDTPVNSFSVSLLINGSVIDTKQFNQTLGSSATALITLDEIDLPKGTSEVRFLLENSIGDLATLNNFTPGLSAGKLSSTTSPIAEGFETGVIGRYPQNAVVDEAGPGNNFVVTGTTGGFQNSKNSIRINFYQWNPADSPANGFLIYADQHKVTTGEKLVFDYAYTSWQGSNDRLKVEISTDCGLTWKSVFNKAGAALKTAAEVNADNMFFLPKTAAEWKKVTIDLASYLDKTIAIRYFVTSAWGDILYIDNINVESVSGINDLSVGESVNIAPNPADQVANIKFELINPADVSLKVVDLTGKVIMNQEVGKKMNGSFDYKLNTSNLIAGLYVIEIQTGDKQVVKRLNIIH